jgi:hypothetical protein
LPGLWLLLVAALSFSPSTPAAPGAGPRVAARALMRKIANGQVATADLLDPSAGLVWLVYITQEDDPSVVKRSRRFCGQRADQAIAGIRWKLAEAVKQNDIFHCSSDGLVCDLGVGGEHCAEWRFEFRKGSERPILETVIETNSTYKPKDEARVIALLRQRQAGTRCSSR